MAGQLQNAGAQPQKQPRYVPLFMDKAFTGLWTQRNVLHDPSDVVTSKFYGGRPDALWQGSNVELTNRNTLQRRPGLIQFSSDLYPTPPNRTFSFPLTDGTIRVIVDTGSTGSIVLSAAANASAGTTVYTGTIPNGGANAYAHLIFQVTGFANPQNNGTFTATASSTTTLTLTNTQGVSETHAGAAVSAGAVYWDVQSGVTTLLFAKAPGAGQTYFVAVAGVLYMGDGVETRIYTPLNTGPNGTVFGFGLNAPTNGPTVVITESGAAAVNWVANTVWSTMGLIYDTGTNTIQQLNSVNASTTNTTQLGTSGNGSPAWNQTPGATTSDNTITWTNFGPIVAWTAHTLYNNASIGGTTTNPCIIYDPGTKSCFINANPGLASGTSGSTYPKFKAGAGQFVEDGSVKWFYIGTPGIPGTWIASHAYPKLGTVSNNDAVTSIVEPVGLQNGLPTNQTVYWQVSGGGTSGSSGTSPVWQTTAGQLTSGDGDLIWLSLGSDAWAATTFYSGWQTNGAIFSALLDPNKNFQVCITTGTSATVQPSTQFTLSAAANASAGTTTYTGTFSPTIPVGAGNLSAVITGFTTAANNGTFTIVSCSSTQLVVNNAAGVSESHAATATFNPWGVGYGVTTQDGSAVWVNVGDGMQWAASTQWFLPTPGFSPPSGASPFGGASVVDSNSDVEFIINSGKGGASHPSWAAIGSYTDDNGTTFTLSQVTVNANGTTTYTGTGLGALSGQQLVISGFTNVGNNGLVVALGNPFPATSTTFTVKTTSQVNETHAGAANNAAIWYNLEAFSTQSLAWTKGYSYAYSYKSRSLTDFYSVNVAGTSEPPIPPGLSAPLPAPTGSLTGDISSASPATVTPTGANAGAVNTISGVGSTNPAVDTIVIWRSADGGGSSNMFELTEVPNPPAIGGLAQPWSFKDFLPDVPTTIGGVQFPGLNELISAPIDDVNDPPNAAFLPMVYNFGRIWGSVGSTVFFSGGPDTFTGNGNSSFNPADDFPYLATVVRLVKSTQGLVTFLTDSVELIAGGPATTSFYQVTLAQGIGLGNYNGLDVYGGEIYFMSADSQLMTMSPSLNVQTFGFPLGDQFANLPSSGVSDATWDPKLAYIAVLQSGIDNALFVGNGSTGWYRANPHQIGGIQSPEPVWSPYANVTNGCKMLYTTEVTPGIKKLLVGSTLANQPILERSLSVFTDNGTPYDAFFVMGSIMLAHPGQIAVLKFVEADFSGVGYQPTISFLLNEISGSFTPFTLVPQFDPPQIYGATLAPGSYSPLRYYFAGTNAVARCRHLQIKVDFGSTSNGDELFNLTIFGRLWVEL